MFEIIKGGGIVAGLDNLIPMSEGSKEEVREIARKGGINSGIARREKATMKRTLEKLLDEVPNIEANKEGKTFREMATSGLILGACEGKAENYKVMLQLLGELQEQENTTTPKLEISIVNNEGLEKVMYDNK
jgi:hypothetical protein